MLPKWLADLIIEAGAKLALDATAWLTEPFTPQHFFDEMKVLCPFVSLNLPSLDLSLWF
jgi:hypothetical protein